MDGNEQKNNLTSLFDLETNQIVKVPTDNAYELLLSGRYAPKSSDIFKVRDSSGELYDVPGADLQEALKTPGTELESPAEKFSREAKEQYGGAVDAALTFGESAASSASLGLTTQALTRSGAVEPETIEKMRIANPTAAIAGEVTGIVAPLLVGQAQSLAGQAVKTVGAPVLGAVKAGQATEKAVAKIFMREGASSPIAKAIAEKIVPTAAGSAVEGSLIGLGQLVDENALGKADINAENMLATVGPSALIGGAVGGALATAGAVIAPAVKFSTKQLEKAAEEFADKNAAALDLLGKSPSKIADLKLNKKRVYDDAARFLKEDLQLEARQTSAERMQRLLQVEDEAGKKIASVANQVDEALERIPSDKLISKNEFYQTVTSKIDDAIKNVGSGFGALEKEEVLGKLLLDAKRLQAEPGRISAKELLQQRRAIDADIRWSRQRADAPIKEQVLRDIRNLYNQQIDVLGDLATSYQKKAFPEIKMPDLGKELRDANKRYSLTQEFKKSLENKATRDASLNDGFWNIAYKIATGGDLRAKAAVLLNIEKANQTVAKTIKKTVDGFSKGVRLVELPARALIQDAVIARDENNKKPKTKRDAVINISENLRKAAADPDSFMERVNKNTAAVYKSAPNTSAYMDITTVRAMSFLGTKVPKGNVNNGVYSAFKKPRFSDMEISKFERYYEAVEQPLETIKKLQNNMFTREHAEAIRTVYPGLYQQLRDSVMDTVVKNPQAYSYNKRVQLGVLLELPTDASLLPENIVGLQANFQMQQDQGAVAPTAGGMQNLNKSDDLETETQRIADE